MKIEARIRLYAQLLRHEGFRASAYQDSEGYTTIGVGRMIDHRKNGGITEEEALYLLANDVTKVERALDAALPWWRGVSEVRQRVLLDMAFNLGIDGLMEFRNMLAAVSDARWNDAANAMLDSLWATQTGERAQRLVEMMRTGKDLA